MVYLFAKSVILILLSLFIAIVALILSQQPNLDQFPDFGKNIQEIVESRGFESETHFIETPDGYILQTIRVVNPFGKDPRKLKPILLHHGFQCSGSSWLVASDGKLQSDGKYLEEVNRHNTNAVGNSLGFVLASQGYDVWLANYRGNIYSTNHSKLSVEDDKFWNFTIDDMIRVDLPAQIDYILSKSEHKSIGYIGHSQGNFMMLGLLSTQTRYSQLIKPFIAISPVSYFTRSMSAINFFVPFKKQILKYKTQDFFTNLLKKIGLIRMCTNPVFQQNLCYGLYWFLFGSPKDQLDFNRLPIYMENVLLGSSTRNFVQLLQQTGHPKYYDFNDEIDGAGKNFQIYQQAHPPTYNYQNINSSHIALIYTKKDWFNHIVDIQLLKDNLNVKLLDDYAVQDDSWNHLELLWAKDVGKYVNTRVLKILENY